MPKSTSRRRPPKADDAVNAALNDPAVRNAPDPVKAWLRMMLLRGERSSSAAAPAAAGRATPP
jgi:hypothetical protein